MAGRFFEPDDRHSGGPDPKRVALVIGNGAYRSNRLQNPPADAAMIADALASLGFDVELLQDAPRTEFETAIVRLGERLERGGKGAIAFFYFAGHGIQHHGINYLIPIDAKIPEVRYLKSGAVPVEYLVEELGGKSTDAAVIVLDACRDNNLAGSGGGLTRGLAAIKDLPGGTIVAFATAAGDVADDGNGANSPYAGALATRLVEPGRRLDEVFFLVARDVTAATAGKQRPALFVQGAVEPIVLREPDATAPPPEDPAAVTAAGSAPPPTTEIEKAESGGLTLKNVDRRQLNVIFAVDCSGSMAGEKINSLNMAMRIAVPEMQKAAKSNINVDVVVRVLRFSTGAQWHIAGPVPVMEFEWSDLVVHKGDTDMGQALEMIAEMLPKLSAAARQLPPLIVLISDGYPSDDFERGRAALMRSEAGRRASRVAIAIGADADRQILQHFIDDPKLRPLDAYNASDIVDHIRWLSQALLSERSTGKDPKVLLAKPGTEPLPDTNSDLVW